MRHFPRIAVDRPHMSEHLSVGCVLAERGSRSLQCGRVCGKVDLLDRSTWGRVLIILGVIAVGLYVAQQLWLLAVHFGDIIILFFLAWLLAFSLTPIVRVLQRNTPLGRAASAAVVYLVLLVVLITTVVLIVPLLIDQISQLAAQLPALTTQIPGTLRSIQATLEFHGIPVDLGTPTAPTLSQEAGQLGSRIVENTVSLASGIASGVFSFTIILIVSFYLVLDGERFVTSFLEALPDHYRDDVHLFLDSIDRSFGGFLRGTAIQASILALGTAVIMSFAGVHFVLLASIFAGVVMVIPFVGPLLALILPLLIGLFSGMPTSQLVVYLIALIALQMLVMNVIAPKVMSESVGLHPLLVFLALLVGAKQAGIAGAIFGVPVAAVINAATLILLRRWHVITPTTKILVVTDPSAADVAFSRQTVQIDRISVNLSRTIARIFQSRSS